METEEEYEKRIAKKPKYMRNVLKSMIFLYSCILQATTIAFALLDTPMLLIQDIFMFLLYLMASTFLLILMIYLYKNRKETFEEANKENSQSVKLAYSLYGERVGLYLRCGLILIGLFSLTYIILFNARILTYKTGCLNVGIIISSITQFLFFFIQVIFILKYHSIIILKHKKLIQFAIYNVILVNIITWEITTLSKISYSGIVNSTNENCVLKSIDTIHLYFLPAVAEFSIIGLAIMYEIFKRIGRIALIETLPEFGSRGMIAKIKTSIPGIIIGIVIVIICILFTIFVILGDNNYHFSWIFYVHSGEEIFLYIFSIIMLIFAFLNSRKLKFTFTFLQNNIDKNLLYVSCFLSIIFSVLITTYCFTYLTDGLKLIRGVCSLLEIIQIIFQTILIQDTFYRCSDSPKQHHEKPGQNFFAILIGCNFGLWILKSFQMKNGDIFFNKYKNPVQNNILFSFFLLATFPLSVLYRYHSSCCFANAFSKIYQGEVDRFEGILRSEGFNRMNSFISKQSSSLNQSPRSLDPSLRLRANTEPIIHTIDLKTNFLEIPKGDFRRQTLKNMEAAKFRIMSSQFSQKMIKKKLSPSCNNDSDSSNSTLQDNNYFNDFNLLAMKRRSHLKRNSSDPLELSKVNDIYSDDTNDKKIITVYKS